jgi:hypothetical protein
LNKFRNSLRLVIFYFFPIWEVHGGNGSRGNKTKPNEENKNISKDIKRKKNIYFLSLFSFVLRNVSRQFFWFYSASLSFFSTLLRSSFFFWSITPAPPPALPNIGIENWKSWWNCQKRKKRYAIIFFS